MDENPLLSTNLVDKHIVKMPLESAQILCTVAQLKGFSAPYKITHQKHPVTNWVAKSSANWNWLCEHGLALSKEYTYRYKKIHKCESIIHFMKDKTLDIFKDNIDYTNHTPFVLCMPDQYKVESAVQSYRNYYRGDKAYIAKWTGRETPEWW